MNFFQKLKKASLGNRSFLCLGMDPELAKIPAVLKTAKNPVFQFFKAIIDETQDLVCAYKPNIAFFEALGVEGLKTLLKIINYIPGRIPVILDAKRGDIGHSSAAYARAVFEVFKADAVTVNPYLGFEALEPFIDYQDKGIFVLCVTTNPGSREFQKCGQPALFEKVALAAQKNNRYKNLGLVVGATQPAELKRVRQIAPELPLLVPGIGSQKGDLEKTIKSGWSSKISVPLIINASRSLIYASAGSNFGAACRKATGELRDKINSINV